MALFGWRQVIVVSGPSNYAQYAAQDFISSCLPREIAIIDHIVVSNPQHFNVSSTVLATGRILVLFANTDVAATIYTSAHNVGVLGSPYFWLSNSDAWLGTQLVEASVLEAMKLQQCFHHLRSTLHYLQLTTVLLSSRDFWAWWWSFHTPWNTTASFTTGLGLVSFPMKPVLYPNYPNFTGYNGWSSTLALHKRIFSLGITETRSQYVNFGTGFLSYGSRILVLNEVPGPNFWSFFLPFSVYSWLSLVCILFVIFMFTWAVERKRNPKFDEVDMMYCCWF